MVTVKEILAKTILRKQKKIESWFMSHYGMNLYRGCGHDCIYCDGRAETYRVEGDFGRETAVKINAPELLRRELDPKRKRKPMKTGYVIVGGGVGDAYQQVEKSYELTRKALQLLLEFNHPVHVLTKSTLVLRDLDLLKRIRENRRVLVSFSFSSADEAVSTFFEPGVPSPRARLDAIRRLKDEGLDCGMYLMPVLPFITDTEEKMEETIARAAEAGVDFIVFAGMTLKEGRQKDYFLAALEKFDPSLVPAVRRLYAAPGQWGAAPREYYRAVDERFLRLAKKYRMAKRIPPRLFPRSLYENDRVTAILEHLDYVLKLMGRSSPYGYAAYSVSKLEVPLSSMKENLCSLKGVGKTTEKFILEILETGDCKYYRDLLV